LAFQSITPKQPVQSISKIIAQPISTWRNSLVNDFEAPLSLHYPNIAFLRDTLYDAGCQYAALSGSGSTVFGIFYNNDEPRIHDGIAVCHKKIRDLQVHITDFLH
jgi:4-diphosphocytidyl-2-C-methyl-D-erythritol kinase